MDNNPDDPFAIFATWLAQAEKAEPVDPNAMTVATTTSTGHPSARMVLLKAWDERGFVFYTNFESRKSLELKQNPNAALLFYWKSSNRQIRIEGEISEVSPGEADTYFATRHRLSRIAAIASAQSQPLPSRDTFDAKVSALEQKYPGNDVPRPPYWSGWRLTPQYFEFWQGIEHRMHERHTYTRKADAWQTQMLYP